MPNEESASLRLGVWIPHDFHRLACHRQAPIYIRFAMFGMTRGINAVLLCNDMRLSFRLFRVIGYAYVTISTAICPETALFRAEKTYLKLRHFQTRFSRPSEGSERKVYVYHIIPFFSHNVNNYIPYLIQFGYFQHFVVQNENASICCD